MIATPRALRIAGALLLVGQLLAPARAERTHVVAPGDTLLALADHYDTSVAELRALNGLRGSLIRVGQALVLPELEPLGWRRHRVAAGETLAQLAERYGLARDTLARANLLDGVEGPLPEGLTLHVPPADGPVVRLGAEDSLLALAVRHGVAPTELVRLNGLSGLAEVGPGDPVLLPVVPAAAPPASPAPASQAGAPPVLSEVAPAARHDALQRALLARAPLLAVRFEPATEAFIAPVHGRLTSAFGWRDLSVNGNRFHGGVDLAAPPGTPVLAARDGRVRRAGWLGAYGYAVFLDHGDGTETRYAHLSVLDVATGALVRQGDPLGRVGSTGASTGPHLHFEIRVGGHAVDPLPYLP